MAPTTISMAMPPATGSGAAGAGMAAGAAGMTASGGAAGVTASGGAGMGAAGSGTAGADGAAMGTLGGKLMYSDELTKGMTVPSKYKCPMSMLAGTSGMRGMGDNKSPPLAWTGGPADTKSFAIVLFDTRYSQFHWALWDIPASVNKLPEGIAGGYDVKDPAGAHQFSGNNTMDSHAYFGPCSDAGPMSGMYEFRLFALNKDKLDLTTMSNGMAIQSAIDGAMTEMIVWKATPE